MELDALAVAEKAGQAEAEGLRAALAGAEMVRKNLEEGKQRELEEMHSAHQEQVRGPRTQGRFRVDLRDLLSRPAAGLGKRPFGFSSGCSRFLGSRASLCRLKLSEVGLLLPCAKYSCGNVAVLGKAGKVDFSGRIPAASLCSP